MTDTVVPAWEIVFFGGLGLREKKSGATQLLVLGDRAQRRLLAYLALHPGRHDRGDLAARLWPEKSDDPAAARAALRVALSRLRAVHAALDAALIADRETLRLAPALSWDVFRFETLLARHGPRRIARLQEAVALYQGDLLPGWQEITEHDAPPLGSLRDRLRQECASACAELMGHYQGRGDSGRAAAFARRALELAAPEAQPDWLRAARAADGAARGPGPGAHRNVPRSWSLHVPPLIGRGAELDQLRGWLQEPDAPRVFTLVGTGGIGKTRIAQAFVEAGGRTQHARFSVVPLGAWHEHALLLSYVGGALYPEAAQPDDPIELWRRFAEEDGRPAVLVLDTLEHLIAGNDGHTVRAQLARALRDVPRLRLLVTSQVELGLAGETVCRIRPLSLPPREAAPVERVEAAESVQLFLRAANRSASALPLNARSAPALARLCRLLNGHPLALRLAAAQFPGETLSAILEQIERGQSRLRQRGKKTHEPDTRHASLAQVIAWSFRRLPDGQQQGFLALSIFRGGFTPEAVTAVCGAEVAARLPEWERSALLDLAPEEMDPAPGEEALPPRYHVLESLRAFAADRLPPERRERLFRRYRAHYADFAEEQARRYRGPEARQALAAVRSETPDLRQALEFQAAARGWEELARTVAGVSTLLFPLPRLKELLAAPAEAALAARSDLTPLTRSRLLLAAANLAGYATQGTHLQYLDEAARTAGEHGDEALVIEIDLVRALAAPEAGPRAAFARRALELADGRSDRYWQAMARHRLAGVMILGHDTDAGIRLYRESLGISLESGSPVLGTITSNALASALTFRACRLADSAERRAACAEVLDYAQRAYASAEALGLELICASICATQNTALWIRGEGRQSYRQAQRGLAHLRSAGGDAMVEGQLLRMLGAGYALQGKWKQAATNLLLALERHDGFDTFHQAATLIYACFLAARRGEMEDAARLAGAVIALSPSGEGYYRRLFACDPLLCQAHDALGAGRWEAVVDTVARLDSAAALDAAKTYLGKILENNPQK